jgi:hypothetical protein
MNNYNTMAEYWVVLQYNNDDNYDAQSIGIFSTKKKAINKILELCKKEYNDSKSDEEFIEDVVEEWFGEVEEPVVWNDFKEKIIKKLSKNGCNGLSYLSYKIRKHVVDEKTQK